MTKRIWIAVFLIFVTQCFWPSRTDAQAGPNCTWTVNVWSWLAAPPGTYGCIIVGVEGGDPCFLQTPLCWPSAAPSENCPCANHAGGKPVSLATGDTWIEETDVNLPGLGGGLQLRRTWNSMWPSTQAAYQIGPFGPNWSSSYIERIFVGADHYIKYQRANGSFWSFGYTNGYWIPAAPANAVATLVYGTTTWTLTFQDGAQRIFSIATGSLLSIVDRNGNTTNLSYDTLNRLTTVTDPASRHLYFSYGPSSFLIQSVTSDFGVTVSYSYDSLGRLNQVTEPDGSTLAFQFDSNSYITTVLDSQNKVLEAHTYDSNGRALSYSNANGAESFTISY
jgi:YD repeat-containing protein